MGKGWFRIPGVQDGDRDLADQLKGLGPALSEAQGKTVLDLGCAEGLIAREFALAGAVSVHGLEMRAEAVTVARNVCRGRACTFEAWDLNQPPVCEPADIALMLAILHKLRQPAVLLGRVIEHVKPQLMVIRLPGPVIRDRRSGMVPFDVPDFCCNAGYGFERLLRGHFDEWVGYFRRKP